MLFRSCNWCVVAIPCGYPQGIATTHQLHVCCTETKVGNRFRPKFELRCKACHHAKNALGAFYRRIQARCGGAKAVVATTRKIAERVYRLLKFGHEYIRQAEQTYEAAYQTRLAKSLARKAESLGYKLVPVDMA